MATLRTIARSVDLPSVRGLSRCYSVFPTTYIKPIYRREEQEKIIPTDKGREIVQSLIKPALTDDTCSEFHNEITRKFTNYIMRKGNKKLAMTLLQDAFEDIKRIQLERYHKSSPEEQSEVELDPKQILAGAISNCTPLMEFRGVLRGGIKYQVPVPMNPNRSRFLAMNWLIEASKRKDDRFTQFSKKLAIQLIDAYYNRGIVIKKKIDLHKQCEENRAYAHYRWT